jgi:hypothetical protein
VALREAATRLADERGAATWRQIASAAVVHVDGTLSIAGERVQRGVAPGLARTTIKNMVRAHELAEVGRDKPAGSRHWMALYAPAEARFGVTPPEASMAPLGDIVRGWTRGV